ncbi:MAG: response regulator [Chloroflexi bacterium]|nr:response regulator [Chloroflexota bacterium]
MKKQNTRVMVASEYPEVRVLLKEMVEREGAVAVGQAPDAPKALTMARELRPDIAIIDCYLPYVESLETLPLSRTGGLDIAQTISEEMPDARVILLNNLDTMVSSDRQVATDDGVTYSIKDIKSNMPLVIQDLRRGAEQPKNIVFANVEEKPKEVIPQKSTSTSDKAIFFGALGIALGWFLVVSMISATAGLVTGLAGIATVALGVVGKLTGTFWHKQFRK